MPDFPFDKLPQTNLTHTISREFPNQYLVKMIPGRISDEICIYKIRPERRLFRTKLVKSYLMPVIAAEAVLQGIDLTFHIRKIDRYAVDISIGIMETLTDKLKEVKRNAGLSVR